MYERKKPAESILINSSGYKTNAENNYISLVFDNLFRNYAFVSALNFDYVQSICQA